MAPKTQPGPIFDNSLRLLARSDASHLCHWLGLPTTGAPAHLTESLPAATRQVDVLTEIAPQQLAHIEFESSPRPDLARRMLEYRARIMTMHPRHQVTQHVIILARGTAPASVTGPGLDYQLNVTYLRHTDPEPLLTSPELAPLAVLARAPDSTTREHHLRRALALIRTVSNDEQRHNLLHTAATLAGIHLTPETIHTLTQEAAMPFTLDENTVAGRIIAATAEARGETRERSQILAALMRHTYGDDERIPHLAEQLAPLPRERALNLALTCTTIDQLSQALDSEPTPAAPFTSDNTTPAEPSGA